MQEVRNVRRAFSKNVIIVFDGYPTDISTTGTKTSDRLRRSWKHQSAEVEFDETKVPKINQEKFL